MANKSIKISIATALNAVGITAAKRALSSLASHTKNFAKAVGSNLMNIKTGFDLVVAGAQKFLSAMSKGMEFERMTVTFKSLTGSMELAKEHMKDLQDLGRTPPFSLETFASASQMMMKMTGGVLGYRKEMELVGDIAAATGNDINQVARSVGLAYQMLRDGQPFGRAGSQMVQLGILTKAQVEYFDELSKSGENNMAAWEELTKVLSKYNGAMAETEKTAKGMVEAIDGEVTVAITTMSQAITDAAKPALEGLLGWLKSINEDGTIELWADRTVSDIKSVVEAAKELIQIGKSFSGAFSFMADDIRNASAFWGALSGGASLNDAMGSFNKSSRENDKRRLDEARKDGEARAEAQAKAMERMTKKRMEQIDKEIAHEQKVQEDLERAQEELDRAKVEKAKKDAAEIAKKREEELEKAAKKREKAELEAQKANVEKMKKLDEERLKEEEKKTKAMIDRLLAVGADKPMQRAGGGFWGNGTMDQAGDLRNERQKKQDEERFKRAAVAMGKKFGEDIQFDEKNGGLKDPKALENLEKKINSGKRLSNLERATLDRLRLDRENKKAQQLQKDRDELQKRMAQYMKDIDDKMKGLGL